MGALKWASLVLAMAASAVSTYGQQSLYCYSYAATLPYVRAEGVTELVGDLFVYCYGGTPTPAGQPVPQVNLQMFFNADVTNRIPATGFADALLLADEPGSQSNPNRLACATPFTGVCSINGTGTGKGVYDGSPGRPNVFQARYSGLNSLTWVGVPIDPPGSNGVRTLRMANVRLHSNQFGRVTSPPQQLTGTLTTYGPNTLPLPSFPMTLAYIGQGLSFESVNAPAFKQCVAENPALYQNPNQNGTPQFSLTFREGMSNAFKPRTIAPFVNGDTSPPPFPQNIPGSFWNSESGYFDPSFPNVVGLGNLGAAGLADQGTRLTAKFTGIPQRVKLFAQAVISNGQLVARMISAAPDGSGAFAPVSYNPYGIAAIPVNGNGEATVVYEVLQANAQQYEFANVPIYVAYNSAPNSVAVTVSGAFGPQTNILQASETDPVARFAAPTPAVTAFSIGKCSNQGMNGSSTATGSAGAAVLTAFDLRCDIGDRYLQRLAGRDGDVYIPGRRRARGECRSCSGSGKGQPGEHGAKRQWHHHRGQPPGTQLAEGGREIPAAFPCYTGAVDSNLISLARDARVYDLAQPYYVGMPHHPSHPPFLFSLTKKHGDMHSPAGNSSAADAIAMGSHVGTHIDGFGHFSCGGMLHGGHRAEEMQSYANGLAVHTAEQIQPIVRRGVLLDAAGAGEVLAEDAVLTAEVLSGIAAGQGTTISPGDVVLIRTGWATYWENATAYINAVRGTPAGPGPDLSGAKWLSSHGIFAAGSDTVAFESVPSPDMPVHIHLLFERGIHIIEALDLEALSRDRVFEFLFVAAPLKLRGGTGAPLRPLALA